MAYCPRRLLTGTVGLQACLIGPEALRRDVRRTAPLQQHRAVLWLVDGPPGAAAAGDLPPRVDGPVPVAVVASVDGVMQHILQRLAVGAVPLQLSAVRAKVRPHRQADAVPHEVT